MPTTSSAGASSIPALANWLLVLTIPPTDGRKTALRSRARRWQASDTEIRDLDVLITELVEAAVPALLERHGIGVHCAAQLLITAGDNPDRLRSEGAFAASAA